MVADSLKQVGAGRSIVLDETNTILAGNGVVEGAEHAGISKVRIIDAEGDELIAVRRSNLTPEQKRALALFDNRTAELAEWNIEQLDADRNAGLDLKPFWTEEELETLASKASADAIVGIAEAPVEGEDDAAAPVTAGDFQTFSCPLSLEQERTVRAALRKARHVFEVTTAGDALTAALQAWSATIP